MRLRPARRRAFRLRRGDDPLCRLDALRHLRPAQREIHRPPRAHQYAALRRLPRSRHRRHPLRLREPGRRDGDRTWPRSFRGTARQSADRADLHRQRPDGELLRPAGMPRLVERESGWKRRKGKLSNGKAVRKGLGMACSHYISGASKPVNWTGEPHATVKIKLDFDGSIVVLSGAAEIGQGSTTILAQTVAEVLGLDLSRVRVVTGDSEVVPKDNGSYSSRVTFMVGNAALDAARNLKTVLVNAAARKLEARPEDIECLGEVYRAGAQDKGATFEEVVTEALKDSGTITVTGNYSTIPESHGGKKYRGSAIGGTMGYSYSAQVVEVSVDEETGVVTVDKVWVAHDCGKALNRLTVEGQVQGSVWMGMGQAMSEEAAYHDGLMVTANMLDYRVPTIQDSPPIEVGIVESNDPHGPFGAKEAGEGSLAAFLPALTNAIADAIGIRFNDLPVTPDRVFEAIEKRRRAAEKSPKKTGGA